MADDTCVFFIFAVLGPPPFFDSASRLLSPRLGMKSDGQTRIGGRWASLLALVWGCIAGAAENEAPRMMILQFKVTPSGVSLVGTTNVVGRVKPQNDAPAGIEYQIRSADSVVLRRGTVVNPLVQRTCFEEVPGSGALVTKYVELPEADLVVRVPADEAASSVRFYERAASGSRAASSTPRLLGEISLK
jgi:hypothetical protein